VIQPGKQRFTGKIRRPSGVYDKELSLALSSAVCDYRCIFCSRGSRAGAEKLRYSLNFFDYRKESLSIQDVIYNGYHKYKIKHIIIGGHEPLNHPNIIRIVSFSKKVGYRKITVQTTGLKFSDNDFVVRMHKAGLTDVDIPIYGSNSRIHDSIVRLKGSYNVLMNSVDNLRKNRIFIVLHTLLLKQNLHDMDNLIRSYNGIFIYYPRPVKSSPYNPKRFWVKISNIPPSIRKNFVAFKIPCIDSQIFPEMYRDKSFSGVACPRSRMKFSPDKPYKVLADSGDSDFIPRVKPSRCKLCRYYSDCPGFYSRYFGLFGDDEFKPIT